MSFPFHYTFTIMEQTPAARFVDVLGRLGYKTQQQIADLLDIARPTAGTIVRYEKPPSFESVAKLKEEHPEINMEWIFTGNGTAFVTGETVPSSQALAIAHAKPSGAATTTLSIAQPTREEYQELQEENRQLREQLAKKDGKLSAVEEERVWLRTELIKKPEASADAAALYETVDEIAREFQLAPLELPEIQRYVPRRAPRMVVQGLRQGVA